MERITQMKKFDLDTSVIVKWFSEDEDDAYFLALSQLESKPFVTADYKFSSRIKGFKNIVNLTEI